MVNHGGDGLCVNADVSDVAWKGNGVLPRLTLCGEIWQRLWQLKLLLLTWQQDILQPGTYQCCPEVQGHTE